MHRHPESGFTLVEVMAALAILTIAMTAVFATFTSQQKSFTTQNRVAEMQQNLRQAIEYMTRDVRLAGYGIPDNVAIPNNVVAAGVTSMRSLYAKDNTAGPDEIHILYLYDMDANQPPTTITAAMPTPSAELNVATVLGYITGDLVIVSNGTSADLFEVTSVQTAALKLQHNPGGSARDYNAPGGHSPWPVYDVGSTLAKARFTRYYIDSSDPAHPTLMVDRMGALAPQPLADDIEDMQFTYGLDTDITPDGVVDTWTPSPASPGQIRQVRIQLLARTRFTEQGWSETRPALGNRPGGTTADGYRRRVHDIVIDVRNSGA
ncbi:MAG: prepilin-type N-terminal cleavage/methylation domain-containing protein [Deltaproteobacteria bacterium]|nr:MAG: prepilin-type N-terminal cleavage/methylation domain-containing protein [Deltaproteobacteria bacterium]